MNLLVIVSDYPYSDYSFTGVYNERCVAALREYCDTIEVLAPRPYAPPLISSFVKRWRSYRKIAGREFRNGVHVHRPPYLQVPHLGGPFWNDPGMYLCCRRKAGDLHRRVPFDAILSFDLTVGGVAWRLGRDLGIPASGWALGSDVRAPASSARGLAVVKAVTHLDLIFYQSYELLEKVAESLHVSPTQMSDDRHMVLSQGIPEPPFLRTKVLHDRIRFELAIKKDAVVALYTGRIVREKGILELIDALSLAVAKDPRITCVLVGSKPGFDETPLVQTKLAEIPNIRGHVRVVPGCNASKIWEYLCAADIFAFPSHNEGMPNSLLEAMAMGLPAVTFAIPPIMEIEAGTGALAMVPPMNVEGLSDVILRLAASPDERAAMGKKARARVLEQFMVRKSMAAALQRLTRLIETRSSFQSCSGNRHPSPVVTL